jgi:hypothetical protein
LSSDVFKKIGIDTFQDALDLVNLPGPSKNTTTNAIGYLKKEIILNALHNFDPCTSGLLGGNEVVELFQLVAFLHEGGVAFKHRRPLQDSLKSTLQIFIHSSMTPRLL